MLTVHSGCKSIIFLLRPQENSPHRQVDRCPLLILEVPCDSFMFIIISYCTRLFSLRINEALVGWVKRYEDERLLKQRKQRRRKTKVIFILELVISILQAVNCFWTFNRIEVKKVDFNKCYFFFYFKKESTIKELALRLASNCTSNVKRKISRSAFFQQGRVARSMVSANHWLSGIKTYRLSWYLTWVSANHDSSNSAQSSLKSVRMRGILAGTNLTNLLRVN